MRCKKCGEKFVATKFLQKTCSSDCETAYRKNEPLKTISKKSDKRIIQENIYKDLRLIFLNKNPKCEVNNDHKATEIHHMNGRENERLNDTKFFMSVCRECHVFIHLNPIESREKGWLI